jgi:hypothetical protein
MKYVNFIFNNKYTLCLPDRYGEMFIERPIQTRIILKKCNDLAIIKMMESHIEMTSQQTNSNFSSVYRSYSTL